MSLAKREEEVFVPGHGELCGKDYLDEQGAFVQEWKEYVQKAIDQGMTRDEAGERLTGLIERYPMDVGQEGMERRVMQISALNLYDYLIGKGV